MDWLASDLGDASDGSCLPQPPASLGVHVDSSRGHFHQPEVGNMVDGAVTSCASGLALDRLSVRLAGNGRREFLGCAAARIATSAHHLALGDH
jgi:hypothetical protein